MEIPDGSIAISESRCQTPLCFSGRVKKCDSVPEQSSKVKKYLSICFVMSESRFQECRYFRTCAKL